MLQFQAYSSIVSFSPSLGTPSKGGIQLDEILNGGSEVATNRQLLESNDHVFPALASVGAIGEDVAELRVCEFVQTTSGSDREVAPDIGTGTEVELLERAAGRLEACIRILGSDTDSDNMAFG